MISRVLKPLSLAVLLTAGVMISLAGPGDQPSRKDDPRIAPERARLGVAAMTYFGGEGIEQFVSAVRGKDGGVIAFGNAWGPSFPDKPTPAVLGKGQWYDVSPWLGGWEKTPDGTPIPPSPDFPNRAGFIAFYSSDLKQLRRVIRFDWAVATISAAAVAADGDLLISGTCTDHMKSVADGAGHSHVRANPETPPRTRFGKVYYEHLEFSGDSYLARLAPDGKTVRWVWTFQGHRRGATQITVGRGGEVTVDIRGLKRISPDGRSLKEFDTPQFGHEEPLLAVNPADGAFLRGGWDRQPTGRPDESWTKPMLWGYDDDGKHTWQLYNWGPRLVALSENRLLASVKMQSATWCDNGEFLLAAHVSGARSVTLRSPIDLHKSIDANALGTGLPPEGGATQLIRIRPKDFAVTRSAVWRGRGGGQSPSRRTPLPAGYAGVEQLIELANGSIALLGRAGTGLPQTPHGLIEADSAGSYLAVLSGDLSAVRFCSSAGPIDLTSIAQAGPGVLAAGSVGSASKKIPTGDGAQPKPAGGVMDGVLILLGGAR